MNLDLRSVCNWLKANKISLNASKTEIIIFRSRNKHIYKKLNFRLSGQKMKTSTCIKYLGLLLDENLNWKKQMSSLLKKLTKATGIIAKLRHYVEYKTLITIYYALFQSHIDYCLQTLGYIPFTTLDKVSKLQNKLMRIIHFKQFRHSARPLYLQSKILPIEKLLKFKNCLFAFNQKRGELPSYFDHFLIPKATTHDHNTKSSKNTLVINMTRTITYGTFNIKNTISKHWNDIIPNLKLDTTESTKAQLKKHLRAYLIYSLTL